MQIDELERSLRRLAGPTTTSLRHDRTERRARQIRRRRRSARAVAAATGVAAIGLLAIGRLDTRGGVALDASGSATAGEVATQDTGTASAPTTESLLDAIRADDVEAVQTHLDAGVDIDAAGRFGFTPLMVASIRGNASTVAILADNGAALEEVSSSGHTALHLAARNGNDAVVGELLERGASIDAPTTNRYGSTALMIAVGHDRRGAIDLLIEGGADVSAVDDVGRPLVYYALDNLDVSPDDRTTRELVEILVNAGATLTSPDGRTERLDERPLDETLDLLIATNSPRQS